MPVSDQQPGKSTLRLSQAGLKACLILCACLTVLTLPAVYMRLRAVLDDPDYAVADIEEVIGSAPAIAGILNILILVSILSNVRSRRMNAAI